MDGNLTGALVAEVYGWTGKLVIAPKSSIESLAHLDVDQPGVYFLVGKNPDNEFLDQVYIGESENVWQRLKEHIKDYKKEFWKTTIIALNKDDIFTKAHALYLEGRFIEDSKDANRAAISNSKGKNLPRIPQSDQCFLEAFIDQIKVLLPMLGFHFISPIQSFDELPSNLEQGTSYALDASTFNITPVFKLKFQDVEAFAQEINGEFVVIKGSKFRKKVKKLVDNHIKIRSDMLQNGLLQDYDDKFYILMKNTTFITPSTAANMVAGTRLNGIERWIIEDSGITYKDWKEKQIEYQEKNTVLTAKIRHEIQQLEVFD